MEQFIKQHPQLILNIYPDLNKNPNFFKNACVIEPGMIQYAAPCIYQDSQLILDIINKIIEKYGDEGDSDDYIDSLLINFKYLGSIESSLLANSNFAISLCELHWKGLRHCFTCIQNDYETVTQIGHGDMAWTNFKYIHPNLRENLDIFKLYFKSWFLTSCASADSLDEVIYHYVSSDFINKKEVALFILKYDHDYFEKLSNDNRNDDDILKAVCLSPIYVDEYVVAEFEHPLKFVKEGHHLLTNKIFAKDCVSNTGLALEYFPSFQDDVDIAWLAIKSTHRSWCFEYLSNRLRNDFNTIVWALSCCTKDHISLDPMVRNYDDILDYTSKEYQEMFKGDGFRNYIYDCHQSYGNLKYIYRGIETGKTIKLSKRRRVGNCYQYKLEYHPQESCFLSWLNNDGLGVREIIRDFLGIPNDNSLHLRSLKLGYQSFQNMNKI